MNVRKNVYKLPAGDLTLAWYSKAVIEMKKRKSTDPTSWNYQAGMHGFNASSSYWQNSSPLPGRRDQTTYWKQCQHQTFFFLPWHRMYLAYFEQIVSQTIASLGGPTNWCLPFWDYSDTTNPNALNIPPAFTSPASSTNGLWVTGRASNSIPASYVSLGALDIIPFIGVDASGATGGFGGPETVFSHSNQYNGRLEEQPHNLVHSAIGGAMGDPDTAALDPIFWLHHANIDRLWQVWLNKGQRANPTKTSWLDYTFDFHDKNKTAVEMKCSAVVDTQKVLTGYTYEGTPSGVTILPALKHVELLQKTDLAMPLEVIAATNKSQPLSSAKTVVSLKLTPSPRKQANVLALNEVAKSPQTTILKFENVKGKGAPPIQDVYLNLPDKDGNKESFYAGSISLFGIAGASTASLHSAGSGQHYALDVSELVNKLRSLPNWNEQQLDVTIVPMRPMDKGSSVTIGRISLYSE
jgi:tyrosinase